MRLRISLPDRPGALAQVATIIADHGGNITSVDVQADVESAVDDLIVQFSVDPDMPRLRDDLATKGQAILVSYQETRVVDPIVGSLRRIIGLIESGGGDADAALADGVAELCSSPVVWVSSAEEAARYDAGRFALERHAAVVMHTDQLPAHLAERLPGAVCLLAVPDAEQLDNQRVIFVARPTVHDFTGTEIARIEALTSLHASLGRLVARARSTPH